MEVRTDELGLEELGALSELMAVSDGLVDHLLSLGLAAESVKTVGALKRERCLLGRAERAQQVERGRVAVEVEQEGELGRGQARRRAEGNYYQRSTKGIVRVLELFCRAQRLDQTYAGRPS